MNKQEIRCLNCESKRIKSVGYASIETQFGRESPIVSVMTIYKCRDCEKKSIW